MKCAICLRRVWWWQKLQVSLGQKLHDACYWRRYFALDAKESK